MEKEIYKDRKVLITNRRILFGKKTVHLVTIRSVELQQIRDPSHLYRTLIYGFAWGTLCIILDLTPIPTVFLFVAAVSGLWWLMNRVWPYAVIAETREGKETVFSSPSREYSEKIALILCDTLDIKIKFPPKTKR